NVVSTLGNSLSRARNSAAALAVYEQGAKAVEKLSTRNYVHNGIMTSYANALINNGKLEEGIKLSKTQIERASNPNVGDYQNIARAYELMGQDLDAFTTLESYLTAGNFNTADLNSL